MTLKRFELLKWASTFLKKHHRDENIGEILMCYRLHLNRTNLLSDIRNPLPEEDEAWIRERVTEHAVKGTPVQYMVGQAPFYGRYFKVTPVVLIPRQETEELVYRVGTWAKKWFSEQRGLTVCDIGTGSGAIAVTLALEHPEWHVAAVDISDAALRIAKENAKELGASVDFRQGDLLEPLAGQPMDILVSNPPYITRPEMDVLSDTVKNYEPHLALFGGDDGLDFYRRILQALPRSAAKNPWRLIAFEIGALQGKAVKNLIQETFPGRIETLTVEKDISGLDRNVMAVIRTELEDKTSRSRA
ncbi:peptide chain release factor N(5)-glutamine methyltransferase [Sporolactobacillus sp. THM7-4]|nr:peptide chain release factor N(5)-glutamine methyltransferase [Sporolactobacillus sp. THM7-4]